MSAKPRLLVPYGLKTLLEGLSRAVLKINPANIAQFALVYFTELLQYRDACPSLDMKDLVQEFQKGKFKEWPETTDDLDSKRMTPQCTEKVLHDSGLFSEMSDSRRTIPQFTGREQASGMTTPQFTGREQESGMTTPQFTGREQASGMATPQFTGMEPASGMTTPQFTGREQASGMATPQFTGMEPASGMTIPQFTLRESASGMTTPQFTGREQESGMTTPQFTGREQASEMTTPQFTGREQESGMTTPQFTGREQASGMATPQFTGREPASGMTTPQFTLRESASGMTTPQFTGRQQESGMTTPQFDSQTNKYVTGQNILESPSADASQMQRTFRDKITQCPSLHRDISNPIISSHGPEALYYPLPSIQSSAEQEEPSKVLSKYSSADNTRQGRDKSPHKAQQSLSDVQRMDTRTFQGLPINQEHLDRVESHALRKPPEFTFEKSDQDTTPSDAALMPDNPNQISHTRSVMYPPDRVMSKTLQADGLPANVVRIVSKTSHYPLAEQFMPSDSSTATAPRSAISSTKQVIDSKFYIEMATTVPPTRAPSQFKVMSGAAERSQRIPKQQPSAPYYELHLAVQNQNEGEPSDSAYVPAMESSVARSFGAISDTHTKIEAKIVQDEKSTLYYNTPVDMRSGSRYPDEPVARVMPYKPPSRGPPQYNPDSVQYDGEVPYYVEQIPQEILHPAPEAATHLYQAPVEQPAYRMMDTENYNPSYQQDASQSPKLGFTDNMGYYNPETYDSQKNYTDQGEREPAKMWTLYRLTDMNQQKPYTPPHQPNAPMFLQNAGEQPPQCNQEYSVNQAYTENMMSTQRSNYQESQFPHGMPQTAAAGAQSVANAPAYTMDEPKRGETHPYLLTGSKVQHKNNWKYIPVHAPVAQNEINAQRKYTTVPIPEALPGIGHPPSQAHDRNIQADPVYYSVLVPLDESHRIASAQSFTHITGQRHHPIYASSHGVSVAVATAASRRPSSAWIGQHHKLSNAGSGQQNMFKGGYGRPPEQNPVSKSRSEWKAPEDTWQS